ncbi:hypothetical protein [Nostoc sp. WHI]|uniref:hypothetical protein n=1 Tax=Nostoc sp. WHI TaxID=2650611 RepID=UPI0018C7D857|nr:hypothetical protein [Nostoc sp. WHI]
MSVNFVPNSNVSVTNIAPYCRCGWIPSVTLAPGNLCCYAIANASISTKPI